MSRWPERTMAERFWEKVDRRGPDECWMWLAVRNEDGYGQFRVTSVDSMRTAHKVAWSLANDGKECPDGLELCHSCDNRACCNPAHIAPGTHLQNVRDSWNRGRVSPFIGTGNPKVKLTEDDVIDIRTARALGGRPCDLARAYGVHVSSIQCIIRRKTWAHV